MMSETNPNEPTTDKIPDEEKPDESMEEMKTDVINMTGETPPTEIISEPENELPVEHDEDQIEDSEVLEKVEPKPVWRPPEKKVYTMRDIIVGKVIVNITTGASGEPLEKAKTVLQNLVNQQPCERRAKQTIRTWGIRKGEPISCMVTLRGEKADEFLKKGFIAVGNRVSPRSFDRDGNFAFGVKEHIDIPGQRYDPNLGIIGMDVIVNLERPGYRIKRKRRARSRIGHSHRVTRDEAMEFVQSKYGVKVELPVER